MPKQAPASEGRRRQGRPPVMDNARAKIVEEAAVLFARNGYESSSIGSLAAAIGLSKAAIYHYFPTKKEIYDAVILDALGKLAETVAAEVAAVTGAKARLRTFMAAHANVLDRNYHGFGVTLVGFGGMDSVDMQEALELRDRHEQGLRRILSDGIESGEFRKIDVATASRAILSMMTWMIRWYRPGGPRSAESFALDYFDLVMGGLHAGDR